MKRMNLMAMTTELLLGDTRAAEQKNVAGVRRTAADRISAGMNIG